MRDIPEEYIGQTRAMLIQNEHEFIFPLIWNVDQTRNQKYQVGIQEICLEGVLQNIGLRCKERERCKESLMKKAPGKRSFLFTKPFGVLFYRSIKL